MANQAHLFSTDKRSAAAKEEWRKKRLPYYASRHSVPLAWFFFFSSTDVCTFDVEYLPGKFWEEITVETEREEALSRFDSRIPLLLELTGEVFNARALVERLRDDIALRPGRFLVFDPGDFGHDPERDARLYTTGLAAVESASATRDSILSHLPYVLQGGWKDADDFELNVVGYTYEGMLLSSAWEPFLAAEGEVS